MRPKERLGLVKVLNRNEAELQLAKAKLDRVIIDAAGVAFTRIQPYRNALVNKIEAVPNITVTQVRQLSEYDALLEAAASESARFNNYVSVQLDVASLAAFEIAVDHVFQISKSFGYTPTIIPPDRMDILRQYFMPDGELMKSIAKWAPNAVEQVRLAVIDGVKLGQSPRTIAAFIRKAYGVNLTDALRMTRTTQIWSYREATRANYIANSDVFKGWIWWASLDDRTCMSCVAQHGSFHPLSEPLDDHPSGRCTMLPFPQAIEVIESLGKPKTGIEWFDKLPEASQAKSMGPEFYKAYKEGKFTFSQLSKQVPDKTFGSFRVESALKDLIND